MALLTADKPLLTIGAIGTYQYGAKLPSCPYKDSHYSITAYVNGSSISAKEINGELILDKKHFYKLKKPGLFTKKKDFEVELYWQFSCGNDTSMLFNVNKLQGQSRKTRTFVPLYVTCSISCMFSHFHARTTIEWAKKIGRKIEPGKVVFNGQDLMDLLTYDLMFNLGDCYDNKVLTSGVLTIPTHVRHGSNKTIEEKLADLFSDASEKMLENTFGMRKPASYAFVSHSKAC